MARLWTRLLFLVMLFSAPASIFAETVRVVVDRATIWRTPTGLGGPLVVVRSGTNLEVRGRDRRWLIVTHPAQPREVGFILVELTEPAGDDQRPPSISDAAGPPAPAPVVKTGRPEGQQSPTAQIRTTARRIEGPGGRPFVYGGAAAQASSASFNSTDVVQTLFEDEVRTTRYLPSRLGGFEGGLGYMMRRNLSFGGVVVYKPGTGKATLNASIPHPIFYGQPRAIQGEIEAPISELDIHAQLGAAIYRGRGTEVRASGGPSIFMVKQSLVRALSYTETYPYDAIEFSGASVDASRKNVFGFNGEVAFTRAFTPRAAWQLSARYAFRPLEFEGVETDASSSRLQVSGGIRFGF